jgi:hypothetical protein
MRAPEPIFIGGMYKSGTSLLRAMLGHHSHLFAGLETQWLHEHWTEHPHQARKKWLDRLAVFFDAPVSELEAACGSALHVETCLDRVLTFLAARAGKQRWIEKTPGNAGAIARILDNWPRARILHIIRDPRDVYASVIESRKKWRAPEDFAKRWTDTVVAARDWLEEQGGAHPAYYELRYERLVVSPETETRKILEFLGEPFEEGVAEFLGQSEDFDRVRKATGKVSTTLQRLATPTTTSRIGVWTRVVPPEEWQAIEAELAREGSAALLEELIAEPGVAEAGLVKGSRP